MSIHSQRTERSAQMVRLNDARRSLADARTLEQVKGVRERAESVRAYAQRCSLGIELQNYACELKLQAERVGGRMLTELRLRGGSRSNRRRTFRLRELGLDKNQSARWQMVATVPESLFRRYVRESHQAGSEISEAGLLRLAKRLRKESVDRTIVRSPPDGSTISTTSHLLAMNWTSLEVVGSDIDTLSDMLSEICNHYELVIHLVKSLCHKCGVTEESSPECRALCRYIAEIHRQLAAVDSELARLSQHPELNGYCVELPGKNSFQSDKEVGCTDSGKK